MFRAVIIDVVKGQEGLFSFAAACTLHAAISLKDFSPHPVMKLYLPKPFRFLPLGIFAALSVVELALVSNEFVAVLCDVFPHIEFVTVVTKILAWFPPWLLFATVSANDSLYQINHAAKFTLTGKSVVAICFAFKQC
jgi:hypothetical protein